MLENKKKRNVAIKLRVAISLIPLPLVYKTRQLKKHKKYREKNKICVIKFLNNIFKLYGQDKKTSLGTFG